MPSTVPDASASSTICDLVILATSDLHLALCPWDFHADLPVPRKGYAPIAALIEDLRNTHPNVLLLDNGDALQGEALGEALVAMHLPSAQRPHPMVQIMNLMRYDAFGLGNHELDFGLDFLSASLASANFPILCANLHPIDGKTYPFTASVLLDRKVTDRQGKSHVLKIGVFSVLPPQVAQWNALDIAGHLSTEDMVSAASNATNRLRSQGADIVVALSHSGIGKMDTPLPEDAASLQIAQIEGVDALIAGHIHEVFPSPRFQDQEGVDAAKGLLAGKPSVMPGFAGSHLGFIELTLQRRARRKWQVLDGQAKALEVATARPNSPNCPLNSVKLQRICQDARSISRRYLNRAAGETKAPLHTYFAQFEPSTVPPLILQACKWHLRETLGQGQPILAAVSMSRCGGRDGPNNYVDLPEGKLRERDLIALNPYHNAIAALDISGEGLRDWLEHSVASYHQITPGGQDLPLMRAEVPPYHFDVIEGVDYEIDLSRSGRNLANGIRGERITALTFGGKTVRPDDRFTLVTTSYRASGGGNYPCCADAANFVFSSPTLLRTIIGAYLIHEGPYRPPQRPNWRFRPMPGTSVTIDTGPRALAHALPHGAECIGPTENGFLRLRFSL